MERPLLFAETPRAGRWNHRFLVPQGCDVDESALAEWAARARDGELGERHIAVVRRDVEQAAGGRRGDELLVLIVPATCGQSERAELRRRLEQRMVELEAWIGALDWEQSGQRLVVRCELLNTWLDTDFVGLKTTSVAPDPRTPGTPHTRPMRRWFWTVSPALSLALLVVIMLARSGQEGERRAAGLWPAVDAHAGEAPASSASALSSQGGRGSSPLSGDLELAHSDAELAMLEAPLAQFATALGVANPGGDVWTLALEVAIRLERDVYLEDVASPQTDADPLARLNQVLGAVAGRVARSPSISVGLPASPTSGSRTLVSLLQDRGVRDRLAKLYDQRAASRLDYLGPLRSLVSADDYDGQQRLRGLATLCPAAAKQDVREFRALIGISVEVARLASESRRQGTTLVEDSTLVLQLDAWAREAPRHAEAWEGVADDPLALLGDRDAEAAAAVLGWLATREGISLLGRGLETEEELVGAARKFAVEKRDLLEALVSQRPPGDRELAIAAAHWLLALEAATPPESAGSSR